MQILTVDIMTELIDLVKISGVKFELYINNDIMYIVQLGGTGKWANMKT